MFRTEIDWAFAMNGRFNYIATSKLQTRQTNIRPLNVPAFNQINKFQLEILSLLSSIVTVYTDGSKK